MNIFISALSTEVVEFKSLVALQLGLALVAALVTHKLDKARAWQRQIINQSGN